VLGTLLQLPGIAGVFGYAERMRSGKKISWIAVPYQGHSAGWWEIKAASVPRAMLGLGVQGPALLATATPIGIAVDVFRMPVYLITEADQMLRAWPAVVKERSPWSSGLSLASAYFEQSPRGYFGVWLLSSCWAWVSTFWSRRNVEGVPTSRHLA
jgi:hypothetical protein